MSPFALVIAIAFAVLAALLIKPLWQKWRRRRWRSQPFPQEWRTTIERAMPLYARIPSELRARLDSAIQQFVKEKEFVGCRGLQVTLEMKLAVAAQACLLILNRSARLYEELYSILLYPAAFVVPQEEQDDAGVVSLHESVLTGEAWDTHRIILSWEDIQLSAQHSGAGYNVVFHEFAHYLDAEDGTPNGAPWLGDRQRYEQWSAVMTEEYKRLQAQIDAGEDTLIDPYGAEDPAEFFAVITETFFELATELKHRHPSLYSALADYYRLDPASWR